MQYTRPAAYAARPYRYGAAHLYKTLEGSRNENGEWEPGGVAAAETVGLYDAPYSDRMESRERSLAQGDGARVYANRKVFTDKELTPSEDDRDGDILKIASEFWRVIALSRWDDGATRNVNGAIKREQMYEAKLERLENQNVADGDTVPQAPMPGTGDLARSIRRYIALGADLVTLNSAGEVTGQSVIPANGPGPTPHPVFATVLLREFRQESHRRTHYEDEADETTEQVELPMAVTASINIYGPGADETAQDLITWIESEAGRREETTRCFTVEMPPGGFSFRRLDGISAGAWEERVQLDLKICYMHSDTADVGYMQTSEIDICLDDLEQETVEIDGG